VRAPGTRVGGRAEAAGGWPEPEVPASVRERLAHVYWIGGSTGAGKTSIARQLGERLGIDVYECDRAEHNLVRRIDPNTAPRLHEWPQLDMQGRWASKNPQMLMDIVLEAELFPFLIDDVLFKYSTRPVIVEGHQLLPGKLAPYVAQPSHAIWLLSSPEFRRRAIEARGSLWSMPMQSDDPPRALRNRVERDRLLSEEMRKQASWLGVRMLEVDGSVRLDEATSIVGEWFGMRTEAR
jgi:2-phosphoglycerate kinase